MSDEPSDRSAREVIARIIDPSSWSVFDGYLQQMLRQYKGENIGYNLEAFQDRKSLVKADAILAYLFPKRATDGSSHKGSDQ